MKKRILSLLLAVLVVCAFGLFALGSGESDESDSGTESSKAEKVTSDDSGNNLGDYNIEIKSCRMAKSYDGKDVIIVTYGYTNNSDDAESFSLAVKDDAFQNDVGLNKAYVLADSAEYNSDSQTKDVRKGATLDVEVAYELNDMTSDVTVEVSQFISFDDTVISKTFKLK